jgi:RND family efflux transporter MFP subunit
VANLKRHEALAAGLTSREQLELKATAVTLANADVRVAEAARNAQRASLERLKLRQAFATVRAPFAGTISARTVERGSLVAAGKASPLFKLTSLETVRVFVQVPQAHVAGVRRDSAVKVSVPEYPRQTFAGTIKRSADALDQASRTMTVEVHVPNPERKLLPGMYGNVALALSNDGSATILSVPPSALVVGEQGVKVATVTSDGIVQLVPVVVERDRGTDIEIASGLKGDEQIVVNLSPSLQEGSHVHATQAVPPVLKGGGK